MKKSFFLTGLLYGLLGLFLVNPVLIGLSFMIVPFIIAIYIQIAKTLIKSGNFSLIVAAIVLVIVSIISYNFGSILLVAGSVFYGSESSNSLGSVKSILMLCLFPITALITSFIVKLRFDYQNKSENVFTEYLLTIFVIVIGIFLIKPSQGLFLKFIARETQKFEAIQAEKLEKIKAEPYLIANEIVFTQRQKFTPPAGWEKYSTNLISYSFWLPSGIIVRRDSNDINFHFENQYKKTIYNDYEEVTGIYTNVTFKNDKGMYEEKTYQNYKEALEGLLEYLKPTVHKVVLSRKIDNVFEKSNTINGQELYFISTIDGDSFRYNNVKKYEYLYIITGTKTEGYKVWSASIPGESSDSLEIVKKIIESIHITL